MRKKTKKEYYAIIRYVFWEKCTITGKNHIFSGNAFKTDLTLHETLLKKLIYFNASLLHMRGCLDPSDLQRHLLTSFWLIWFSGDTFLYFFNHLFGFLDSRVIQSFHCLMQFVPGKIPSFLNISHSAIFPLLKQATASWTPNSKVVFITKVDLGVLDQIMLFSDSLGFWVLPCKHSGEGLGWISL